MSRLPEEVLSVLLPRSPVFPVDLAALANFSTFLIESRTCSLGWSYVQKSGSAPFFRAVERWVAGPLTATFRLSDKIQSAAL